MANTIMINPDPNANDPMELMRLAAMNINGLSQQMGLMNKAVTAIKDDVSELRSEMVDVKADVRGLKDDQFVDLINADNIKLAAQSRVAELLDIVFEERGGVTEESMFNYRNYYSKFIGRLHVDARHAGLEGPRIYATPRKNYQALMDFINEWVPLRGVEGLMSYYDGLEATRKSKKSK